MSVPSTLQKTHDECGGTVVFRPATRRRALLAGETVSLQAACRSCGATVRIEWSLVGSDDWTQGEEIASSAPGERNVASAASGSAVADEVREIEAQLASIAQQRVTRARAAVRRAALEQEQLHELPMAAGAETQWFDPEQYPALARAHRNAVETFEAIEAELHAVDTAFDGDGPLDWRAGSYANMLEVEAEPELAPDPDVNIELEAALTREPTRIARGFGATPETASKEANDEIDIFLGKFAERVARARTKLEDVQTNLPAVVAESRLRTPELRSAPVVEHEAVEQVVVEQEAIVVDTNFDDVVVVEAPEITPATVEERVEALLEPEFTTPEAEVEPEPEISEAAPIVDEPVAVVSPEAPVDVPVAEIAPIIEPIAEPVAIVAPEAVPEPVLVEEPVAVQAPAPVPVAVPVPAPAQPETVALPRVELAPPAPVAVEEYPTPLHERIALQSTSHDVFVPRPVAAPELVAEVWGDAPEATPQFVAAPAAPTVEFHAPIPEPVINDAPEAAVDLPEAPGSFGALISEPDAGFDWSDEDEAPAPAPARAPKAKKQRDKSRDKARDKARAKARKARKDAAASSARKRPFGSRKPAARTKSDAMTSTFAAVETGSAVASAPVKSTGHVRVRMGLPEVAIVVILAMVAGIAFMKLVSPTNTLPPAATSSSATGGDLVSGSSIAADGADPTNAPNPSSTQDPAAAADTAATASSEASPQSTPSADA